MKQRIKRILALLFAACLTLFCAAALADIGAEADKTSVQPGDAVTVTLSVTGKNLSVAEGTFTYDPALLSFTESDGGAADGFFTLYSAEKNGSATLRARIVFTALAAGEANIEFTLQSLLDYKGSALDTGSASVTVSIAAAPATPTPSPVDYSDPAVSVKAQNVRGAQGDMYVWRSIENVTIPSRYAEADVDYHGETVKGATVANTDAPTLLYLSDASGGSAGFYIYDAAGDALYPYRTVSSVSKSYILLAPDGSVSVPEGFAETTLEVAGSEVQAWIMADAQGTVYLLYARNPDGEVGFYLYNPEDESLQRYAVLPARPVAPTLAPTASPAPVEQTVPPATVPAEEAPDGGRIVLVRPLFFLLCGAGFLFLSLFITTIAVYAVREKRRERRARARMKEREKSASIDE
jgi:hypothetical protein